MQPVPRIFVSATSKDLKTARQLVSEGLRKMECLPIVQDDFPPDYKSVRDMLRAKIGKCDAVVHLVNFYYGAEPMPIPAESERRSFMQLEYEIANELGLPCYAFLCGEDFPFDAHEPEPELRAVFDNPKSALEFAQRVSNLDPRAGIGLTAGVKTAKTTGQFKRQARELGQQAKKIGGILISWEFVAMTPITVEGVFESAGRWIAPDGSESDIYMLCQ